MLGQTISHYRITQQLGAGGMGVVYEAVDLKLDRTVALKFLSPNLTADAEAKARFVREAKAASALDHPNICSIYEINETDEGRLFIAMARYEGETLKERIDRGPLPLGEALSITRDIARGLAKAHEQGIVHRDIKPANIFLTTDGLVKILDFGLAKVSNAIKITRAGSTLGTVAYMSPEQVRGERADNRTDLWCLGAVLYEMVTGRPPFPGEQEQAVVYGILNEAPLPATGLRTGMPVELERLIGRCLEKDPRARYQTSGDLASDVSRVQRGLISTDSPTAAMPVRARHRLRWILPMGAVIVLVLALMTALYPRLVGRRGAPPVNRLPKLVVLPFENLGATDDEYFADGITEEITSRLAVIKNLRVISRTSALHYKNSSKTIKDIGDELAVGYVLEGTVRWERTAAGGSRIRVTPRLVRVADDSQVWAEVYDDAFAAIFEVQTRIAHQVAAQLDVALTGSEQHLLGSRPTKNVVAYQLYLRGIDRIAFGHQPEEDYRQAQQLLEQAIAIDPDFALAYAKLSEAHRGLYFFGYEHTAERLDKTKQAMDKARDLDPELPEIQRQLGYYYYQGLLDYDQALIQFSSAAKLLPNDVCLLQDIAYIWRRQGRPKEALANLLSALDMSPTDAGLCVEIAYTYMGLRMHDEALAYCNKTIAMAPDNSWGYFLKALLLAWGWGDLDAAERVLDSFPGKPSNSLVWAHYHIALLARDFSKAHDWLKSMDEPVIRMQSSFLPVSMLQGLVYRYQGEREPAKAAFEAALGILDEEVRDNPEDARIHSSLGITLAGMGRKEEAMAAGREAVALYPVSKDAILSVDRITNLAQVYALVGEAESALELIREILSMPCAFSINYFELHPCFDEIRRLPDYSTIRARFSRNSS